MKKGFALFTALFLISTFTAFAAVTAVKEGDVVKVTWTYENDEAASVGLVGDFQGWNLAGALPMAKVDGKWSITLDGNATSEYLYKLNVDGEWTEDPSAPGTFDDGFGGLNGKVVVADLLAAGPGAVASGPRLGLSFATYTQTGVYADFLTKDVKEGKKDGFELDKVGINLKSYWKFAGDFLPGNRLDLELAVVDNGGIKLYQSNTDGKDTPFVTWADGVNNIGDFFFNPFTAFAGQKPYLGHFKYTLTTPWVKVLQGYNYAKTTIRDGYIFETVKEDNSGDGTVEISNTETLHFGGITLDATVALSKRTTKYGAFGWFDLGLGKDQDVSLSWATLTAEKALFNYWKSTTNLVDVAYDGKFGDLSVTSEVAYTIFGGTQKKTVEALDAVQGQIDLGYSMGDFGIDLSARYAGDSVDMVYGKAENNGKIFVEVAPSYSIAGIDIGLTANAKLDNYTSTNKTAPGIETYVEPSVGYTMGDMYFGLFGGLNINIEAESTKYTGQPIALKFTEVDFKFSMANLGPGKLTTQAAFVKNNGNFDGTKYADKGFDVALINQYELADQLTLYLSGIYRAKGEDELTDATTKLNPYDKESVFGASVGVNKVLISQELKNPQLFFLFDYNMNPWSGDYKTNLDQEDEKYRWDSLDAGKGKASARVGAVWSF